MEDDSTVIPVSQSDQVVSGRSLADQAKFAEKIFRKGERYSARVGRTGGEGSHFIEQATSQPQTTASVVESEVRGAGALPQLPSTKTETVWLPLSEEVKYQVPSPPIQGADLEWEDP